MSIKKYETFLKTVDMGSLTRASEVMGYTQSAISHMLTSLEEDLGLKLLIRDRSGVRLTEEGQALIPAIREVCQANQIVLRRVSQFHGLEIGTVRIGSFLRFSVHLLPDLIASFSEQYPNIEFELLQGNYSEIERWVSEGRVDCGFTRLPLGLSHLGHSVLMEERLLAVFPQGSAPQGNVLMEDLQNSNFISPVDIPNLTQNSSLEKNKANMKIRCSDKDDSTILAMVERSLGVSVLPELLLAGRMYRLQSRELSPPLRQNIGIIYKDIQTLSPAARYFVYLAQDSFARAPNYE